MNDFDPKILHEFYLTCRKMLKSGIPRRGVQRGFEELVYSIVGKDAWRPTHVSIEALRACVHGDRRAVQRAHGVLKDRKDRFDRTLGLLEGPEQPFEVWWSDFLHHDKTVLITRTEHSSGKAFQKDELVPTPEWSEGMFENSGFNVRIRKRVELVWMREKLEEIEINKEVGKK